MSDELYLYFIQSGEIVSLKKYFQDNNKIIVGRKKECDLHFSLNFGKDKIMLLSGQHFMIYQKNSRLFIEDLDSTNGTEIDNKKLLPKTPVELRVGNIIRLAKEDDFLISLIDDQTMKDSDTGTGDEKEKESGIHFDEAQNLFTVDGSSIYLSQTLHDLLKYLYDNHGRSCPYHELNKYVWFGNANKDAIRAAVYHLRLKLEHLSSGAGGERYIKTLHGYGYKLMRK